LHYVFKIEFGLFTASETGFSGAKNL